MERFAIYGKGGGGKSFVASNLSVQFTRRQLRTLQIGCDPKHDSTRSLTAGRRVATVMDLAQQLEQDKSRTFRKEDFLFRGHADIGCIEAGGPESGVGCAGLGIVAAFRLMQKYDALAGFDVVVMDVLGDVVCGGFAMPLMKGLAGCVTIVVAETMMSLYAANNIAKAVQRYERNGAFLAGLVANNVRDSRRLADIENFAERLHTRLLATIPHDDLVRVAERQGLPVSALAPGSPLNGTFAQLAATLLEIDPSACASPTPMGDQQCDDFFRGLSG